MPSRNPLIPMGAITGDLSREQIHTMLDRYAEAGIDQFLLYPRDGCDVPYMSERWFELCGDIIEYAAQLGMSIWLYDEFNWPSGTCKGAVMAHNPDFVALAVKINEGNAEIVRTERFVDVLNPDAVDTFIRLTHEAYFARFGKYFGTTVKGFFTDEPSFIHSCRDGKGFPYSRGIEELYRAETGRSLFYDFVNPTPKFLQSYFMLLARRFRQVYVDRIATWCQSHNVLFTGHLLGEDNMRTSVFFNGNTIHALRGFSVPGMDEIATRISTEDTEWLTVGTLQAAIRETGRGGFAELFALGPADITLSRIEQMIWFTAMFGIDHYVLAVSAADARGNALKSSYFNPMNYMNPWFAGMPFLGDSAKKAAEHARKTIAANVYFRYPATLTAQNLYNPDRQNLTTDLTKKLLWRLTLEQYQWLILDEEEQAPEGIPVIQMTDAEIFDIDQEMERLKALVHPHTRVLTEDGQLPEDILLREYTDGAVVILDLSDSDEPRRLCVQQDGDAHPLLLTGRGHHILGQPPRTEYAHATALSPMFRLATDRPNTLRVNFREDCTEYTFRAAERLEGIRLLMRSYRPGGDIALDGVKMTAKAPANALTPGLSELYYSTEPVTLGPGVHTLTITTPAEGELFFPSCLVCGNFASDHTDTMRPMPDIVPVGTLQEILPQFTGRVTLETVVPLGDASALLLEADRLYTRVYADDVLLGEQIADFCFQIPGSLRGKTVNLKIEQYTSVAPLFGRAADTVPPTGDSRQRSLTRWFPKNQLQCGIRGMYLLK